MDCVHRAVDFGYGTVVMQSGEDYGIKRQWMAGIIRRHEAETAAGRNLRVGERPDEDLVGSRRRNGRPIVI